MPEKQGLPMQIHTDPKAVPHLIHRPASVPLHWREAVTKGIEEDVKRGILEKFSQEFLTLGVQEWSSLLKNMVPPVGRLILLL